MFVSGRMLIYRFKCFKNFLCIYLGQEGGALMHVYVWEHIISQPLLQNRLIDVYEIW